MKQGDTIKAFKGMDKDMKCRGFQFEVGKEYEEDKAEACKSGFHSCLHPLDVFRYYPPKESRYFEVEASGDIDDSDERDTKIASTRIKIGEELSIAALVDAAVKFTFDRAKKVIKPATGDQGAALVTGVRGAALATGEESIACALGFESRAKGAEGCWLVLAERDDYPTYHIKGVVGVKVDGEKIKPDTYYMLRDGEVVKA